MPNVNPEWVIHSIMPATNWFAIYLLDSSPWYVAEPLVCFALGHDRADDEEERVVIGMVSEVGSAHIECASNALNFHAFHHGNPSDSESSFVDAAQSRLKERRPCLRHPSV